jgi:hypothetical protein
MNGAIPPLPNTPQWCGAQLNHRDNFTFYLLLCQKGETLCRILNFYGTGDFHVFILRVLCVKTELTCLIHNVENSEEIRIWLLRQPIELNVNSCRLHWGWAGGAEHRNSLPCSAVPAPCV